MKHKWIKLSATTLSLAIATMFLIAPAQESTALLPLSYEWECYANGSCNFTAVTNNHNSYGWNFDDGSALGSGSSTNHFYAAFGYQTYNVKLIGYKSNGTSVDNIVGCDVTFFKSAVGGDPSVYSGTC